MARLSYVELLKAGDYSSAIVTMALAVHADAQRLYGHDVALLTERTYRDLRASCVDGDVRRPLLTCYQCGAVASLHEWYHAMTDCCGAWPRYVYRQPEDHQDDLLRLTEHCPNTERLAALALADLESLKIGE